MVREPGHPVSVSPPASCVSGTRELGINPPSVIGFRALGGGWCYLDGVWVGEAELTGSYQLEFGGGFNI